MRGYDPSQVLPPDPGSIGPEEDQDEAVEEEIQIQASEPVNPGENFLPDDEQNVQDETQE